MNLPEKLKTKLRELPDKPGCYLMRDRRGQIIYVGRAGSLRKRVQSYFRRASLRSASPKLRGLIKSVDDLDVIVLKSEADAVLTEGMLIKEYRPRYNTFFKDDKRFLLLRVDFNKPFPRFDLCRIQRNDSAVYFGPFASSASARIALEFVEKYFGVRKCRSRIPGINEHKHCINDIVRFCSAPCIGKVSAAAYRDRVDKACAFLRGEIPDTLREIEAAMKEASEVLDFERAAALRDNLRLLRMAVRKKSRVAGSPGANAEKSLSGVRALRGILGMSRIPHVIEAYDVSNISGTHAVASMVMAQDGIPKPARYRRFRIKTVHSVDDAKMIAEAVHRRFVRLQRERGQMPDLILVDGGVNQVRAVKSELQKIGVSELPVAGLAKRFEDIYIEKKGRFRMISLPAGSPALKVFQRLRDEAHRFALKYHLRLREKKIRESLLDEIPGIGEKRKQLLLERFGSVVRLARASESAIAAVPGVGEKTAGLIKSMLKRKRTYNTACKSGVKQKNKKSRKNEFLMNFFITD